MTGRLIFLDCFDRYYLVNVLSLSDMKCFIKDNEEEIVIQLRDISMNSIDIKNTKINTFQTMGLNELIF